MKIKKILAGIMASAVAASAMAVMASANEGFLMYAAGDWSVSAMGTDSYPDGNIDVTSDGTYTVTTGGFTFEDQDTGELVPATANGAVVFCIDITDLAKDLDFTTMGNKDADTPEKKMALATEKGIKISDVTVTTKSSDGTTQSFDVDESKLIYGDLESNGKLRIEIYNEYGNTKNDPPFDNTAITFDDTISVTFTITGIPAAADAQPVTDSKDATAPTAGDTAAATDSSKGSPDTGVADVAAVAGIAVVAAGAFIVAKKRK